MQLEQFKERLETCGLPVAYRFFPEGEAPSLPYVVYYESGERNFPADGENYHNIKQITVELYTREKDTEAEKKVEDSIAFAIWDKTEEYISSEKCYQIVYYLEV